jgi:hypothetical protein
VDLAAAFEDVDALLGGGHRVAVEIGGPLLEPGEVLHGLQGPLGAEPALDVDAPQGGRVAAVPEGLGPGFAGEVGGAVGVPVGVAVEAGHAAAGAQRTPERASARIPEGDADLDMGGSKGV